jgi:2,6-dihydroxypyridine 3-monooxygenase
MTGNGWPRVLVAGGSIGGLTTGLLLRDLGCEVDIFERAGAALEDRGAGIVVLPITERYFTEHAPGEERVSLELTNWTYVDRSGSVISADADHFRFGSWSSMYRALLEAFGRERYHYHSEVIGFEQDGEGVTASLRSGESVEGDLLVFADGFSSTGRSLLLPEVRPEYAGYVAWRGTTPEAALSGRARADVEDAMIYQVLDPGHILVYAIPGPEGQTSPPDRSINFVWYRNYPMDGSYEDLMLDRHGNTHTGTMPPGDIRSEHLKEMRDTAESSLAPTLLEVVAGCEQPLIQAVFDVHCPRMAFDRVCLLGDAATTLRPHIAAGQAKACADGWALRDALAATGGGVEAALASWEPGQLALAGRAIERTRAMGAASQFESSMVPGDPAWKFGLWEPGN